MKKLISISSLVVICLFKCNLSCAQNSIKSDKTITGKVNTFQLSLMAGLNSGAEEKYSKIAGTGYSKSFDNIYLVPKVAIEKFIYKKIGGGVSYSTFTNSFEAERYAGSVYYHAFWFIFYTPATTIIYNDYINITTSAQAYSGYGIYKIVDYSKPKHQRWEVSGRAGISYVMLTEKQRLVAYNVHRKDGIDYLKEKRGTFSVDKRAWSCFANAQVLIHLTKNISLILADLTKHFGLVNPSVSETSISVENIKTVTVKSHKIDISQFSYLIGLGIHF